MLWHFWKKIFLLLIFIHKFVPIENTVATEIKLKIKNDPVALDHVEEILHKKGVDIMSTDIEKKDNLIYCNRFVCLNENGKVKNLFSVVVLKLAEGSDRDVVGYYK